MDFTFSEEQNELRRAARRFLDVASSADKVDAAMKTERGYDPEVWQRMAQELGWVALTIPEAYDGVGLRALDLHLLMEEMGRAVLCSPFFSTVCLGVNALLAGGTEEQKQTYLPKIAAGELTATVAYTEENGRWDASGIAAVAQHQQSHYVISGKKSFVLDGHTAGLLIVAAREEGTHGEEGVQLFVVPPDTQGVTRRFLTTMDQTRRLAEIELHQVQVPASARLSGADGWDVLQHTLNLASIALAAEQVGGAEACLDMAVAYAKVRQQFGRPIGSFQAIKHKCADMFTEIVSARSVSFYASALAAESTKESQTVPSKAVLQSLREAASSAKAYASDVYFQCAAENIQIHGGIGFTWEHAAHLYFKRAKSSETLFGDASVHRAVVASALLDSVEASTLRH